MKRYNQTLVLIPILFQAIVVAVGFSAGLYFIFQGDEALARGVLMQFGVAIAIAS